MTIFRKWIAVGTAAILSGCGASGTRDESGLSNAFTPNYLSDLGGDVARWSNRSVTVSATAGVEDISEADLQALVGEAASRWNSTDSGVSVSVVSGGRGDVNLTFAPPDDPDLAGRVIGVTTRSYQSGSPVDRMLSADIKIESGQSEESRRTVVAHELGHALGIGGHSAAAADLMYAAPAIPGVPTEDDANTLKTIYSSRAAPAGRAAGSVVTDTISCER